MTAAGLVGEGIRSLLVAAGVGLFAFVAYRTAVGSTVRGTPDLFGVLSPGLAPVQELVVRASVAAAAAVLGTVLVAVGALVPGEVPYPLVPDPGLSAAGRRRVAAGVLVVLPAVPELVVAGAWTTTNPGLEPAGLAAAGLATTAVGTALVLSGLSTGRSPWAPVPELDGPADRVARVGRGLRPLLDDRSGTWGPVLATTGALAVLAGGLTAGVLPGTSAPNPPYRAPALPVLLFAVGLPVVYAGVFRTAGYRPPGSAANWSPEARLLWVGGLAAAGLVAVFGTGIYVAEALAFPDPPSGRVASVGAFAAVGYFLGAWTALSGLVLRAVELLAAVGRVAVGGLRGSLDGLRGPT